MIIKLVRHGSGKGHIIHHKRVGVLNTQNREAWYEQKENNRISRCCRGLYSGLCIIVIRGKSPNPAENPEEMLGRIENALGDEYKKQSMTELVATLKYGDEEGNEINYYILKTTYYEADPAEITGLNTEAIKRIVNPDRADSCQKMKIQDWDAALYERGELSYLCWTYSPEVSYILEYSPYAFADEEIIKMAESAKPINEE